MLFFVDTSYCLIFLIATSGQQMLLLIFSCYFYKGALSLLRLEESFDGGFFAMVNFLGCIGN